MSDFPAIAFITIDAPRNKVWRALTDPQAIKNYMFGTDVQTDWRVGRPITWTGEFEGKSYKDKGKILAFEPEWFLKYTHFSPLAGLPDEPGSYHTVTIQLERAGDKTRVSLTQDNNQNKESRAHSEKNWKKILDGLKRYVESDGKG